MLSSKLCKHYFNSSLLRFYINIGTYVQRMDIKKILLIMIPTSLFCYLIFKNFPLKTTYMTCSKY